MKLPKYVTEFQDLVNNFSMTGIASSGEELESFRKRGNNLVAAILRQELSRDDLEHVDRLFRQFRSIESINLLAQKMKEDEGIFDDEFDYIEQRVSEITNEKWLAYRDYPISESPSHGTMLIMYLEKKPDQPWIYYLNLNKFKRLGDPLDPDKVSVPMFVHSAITKPIQDALKDAKIVDV